MTPSEAHHFSFTEARIRAIPNPAPRVKVRYRDATCPGLALRVMGSMRAFIFYGKADGRPVEIRLGTWPTLTVEEARKLVRVQIAPDPTAAAEVKRSKREALTLMDAWEALAAHPTRRRDGAPLRPATWRSYQEAWEHLRPHLGARLMADISGEVVTNLRATLLRKVGAAQTRRALALLVVLMGGRMPRDSHGRTVQKPRIEPRRRFMDASELGAFLRGLAAEPPLWRVFWFCCLLAPLRRGNVAKARWADLNLDHPARWMVSSEDAKGGKLLALPIADPLARILRTWRAENPREIWVFPAGLTAGPRAGKGPIVSVQHAWARALQFAEAIRLCDAIALKEGKIGRDRFRTFLADLDLLRESSWTVARAREPMEREGTPLVRAVMVLRREALALGVDPEACAMANLTPHDLRRTAASWAVQSGASLAVVAASLGHADTRVTEAHYGHLADDPVRRMLADNAGRLLATMGEQIQD